MRKQINFLINNYDSNMINYLFIEIMSNTGATVEIKQISSKLNETSNISNVFT